MSNELLLSNLWDVLDGGGMDKTAAITETFIRDRIRETSVLNQAIPPVFLTEAEIERNTFDDFPLKRVDIEPDSKALTIGFRAKSEAKFWDGRRFEVYFNKFESQHFKKTREELMTMRFPVTQVLQSNFVLDIQEQLDRQFRARLDAAATAAGNIYTASGYNPFQLKEAIQQGMLQITNRRRRATRMIMTEGRYTDIGQLKYDDWGPKVADITISGNRDIKTFMNLEVITSINSRTGTGSALSDIDGSAVSPNGMALTSTEATINDPAGTTGSAWPNDSIYLITDPNFLGSNFVLGDLLQEFDRKTNMLEWWCWQDQGFEIGNIFSVARIDLLT